MPFIALENIQLYYEVKGSGPRLLLIGGTGWDLRVPKSLFERGLQKHFEVLRYDQRGQGQSDKPDIAYTMQDYADDAAHLLQALGWDSVLVLGISFGGMVAQEFCLRHPQLVQRLVLACTSSGGAGGASFPIHTLEQLPLDEYASQFLMLANRTRDAAWQATHQQLFAAMQNDIRSARENMTNEARIGLQRQLGARMQHDTWQRLPQINFPVLLCGGVDDELCPPQNLHNLAQQIPGAQLQMFKGGHGFYMEDPRAATAIREFLMAETIN